MAGKSSTSHTKHVHRYYKCVSVKYHRGCDKKTVRKEWIEALEREKSDLSVQIMKEEMSRPNLTKEQILFWIYKFRKLNPKKLEHRRRLVNSFLNSVYLYDDKIIIDCNYKDGTETITFKEIENSALGSDLTSLAAVLSEQV